jgi:hypothetical protein
MLLIQNEGHDHTITYFQIKERRRFILRVRQLNYYRGTSASLLFNTQSIHRIYTFFPQLLPSDTGTNLDSFYEQSAGVNNYSQKIKGEKFGGLVKLTQYKSDVDRRSRIYRMCLCPALFYK